MGAFACDQVWQSSPAFCWQHVAIPLPISSACLNRIFPKTLPRPTWSPRPRPKTVVCLPACWDRNQHLRQLTRQMPINTRGIRITRYHVCTSETQWPARPAHGASQVSDRCNASSGIVAPRRPFCDATPISARRCQPDPPRHHAALWPRGARLRFGKSRLG